MVTIDFIKDRKICNSRGMSRQLFVDVGNRYIHVLSQSKHKCKNRIRCSCPPSPTGIKIFWSFAILIARTFRKTSSSPLTNDHIIISTPKERDEVFVKCFTSNFTMNLPADLQFLSILPVPFVHRQADSKHPSEATFQKIIAFR